MDSRRSTGLEELMGIGVGTLCAVTCTLLLVSGSSLFDLGSSIPPVEEARTAPRTGAFGTFTNTRIEAETDAGSSNSNQLGAAASATPEIKITSSDFLPAVGLTSNAKSTPARPSPAPRSQFQNAQAAAFAVRPRPRPVNTALISTEIAAQTDPTIFNDQSRDAAGISKTWAVVHFSNEANAAIVDEIIKQLRDAGIDDVAKRRVTSAVNFSQLRFYFETDRVIAETVLAKLDDDQLVEPIPTLELSNFSSFKPRPKAGLLEIWIADN